MGKTQDLTAVYESLELAFRATDEENARRQGTHWGLGNMSKKTASAERLADHFVNYLFDQYQGSRHVRRVATWIGFLLKAIEKIPGAELRQIRVRQVAFDYKGRRFKVRYNHRAGRRGGIEFVEILPGRGQPEGDVAVQVTSLDDAEGVYRNLKKSLDAFVKSQP